MSARSSITCRELIDFLADYLDGALTDRQRQDFQRHLAICPSCRAYLSMYETTIRTERAAFGDDEKALAEAPEELIRAILETRRG